METFNKYSFIDHLESDICSEIESGNIKSTDQLDEYILSSIDNACIYYSYCFDICKELNATNFDDYSCRCANISELAFQALYEYSSENLDFDLFDELLQTINA